MFLFLNNFNLAFFKISLSLHSPHNLTSMEYIVKYAFATELRAESSRFFQTLAHRCSGEAANDRMDFSMGNYLYWTAVTHGIPSWNLSRQRQLNPTLRATYRKSNIRENYWWLFSSVFIIVFKALDPAWLTLHSSY